MNAEVFHERPTNLIVYLKDSPRTVRVTKNSSYTVLGLADRGNFLPKIPFKIEQTLETYGLCTLNYPPQMCNFIDLSYFL